MSRKIVCAITTAMVLACIVVGFTVAFGTSDSASGTAFRVKPDFDLVFASVNAEAHSEDISKIVTGVAFDQVFASITRPQPDNTPQNREKLRNAGWRRVLQKS
jgi:ammonia channel protein AmtB